MKDAAYSDPKFPVQAKRRGKIAVVITFFDAGKKSYWGHFVDEKLVTLKMNLRAHAHFNPGVDYDLIIVNHSPELIPEDELSKHYPHGGDQFHEDNFGFSFGGYKQAWDRLKDSYDFYCFTEDDIAPAKDGWLAEILAKFMSSRDIGAVGNIVEARSKTETGSDVFWNITESPRDMMYNFDGAFTFTSSKILKQVDEIGGLRVMDCEPNGPHAGTTNEVLFQERILELGYRIESFADGEHFVVHGSEILTNDVANRTGSMCPLMNLNGRHKIPEIKELYKFL